jgi:hypothetical protein
LKRNPRGGELFSLRLVCKESNMTERKRSRDGVRETEWFTEGPQTPGQQGRSGAGDLPHDIGTRDEKRRAEEGDAGVTRVRKSDERTPQ